MRQVMPHRNNIELRRTKIKRYFSIRWKNCSDSLETLSARPRAQTWSEREFSARTGI
ncbi:MAG TPA: hypothetical protein VKU03_06940 [Roseiarcus sp.]|nr:hypothetical protein [Roseiarcus sp.]